MFRLLCVDVFGMLVWWCDGIADARVEVLSGTDDKAKGGNDFQEVRKVTLPNLVHNRV